jgi:hypothetical protein
MSEATTAGALPDGDLKAGKHLLSWSLISEAGDEEV